MGQPRLQLARTVRLPSTDVVGAVGGDLIENALVHVYEQGTTTPVDLWDSATGGAPVANPLTTGAYGTIRAYVEPVQAVTLVHSDNGSSATIIGTGRPAIFSDFPIDVSPEPGAGVDLDLREYAGWRQLVDDVAPFIVAADADLVAAGRTARLILPFGSLALGSLVEISDKCLLTGRGAGATILSCEAADAGLTFGTQASVGYRPGGRAGGFRVDGHSLATRPLIFGHSTNASYEDIEVFRAAEVCVVVDGSQNIDFYGVVIRGNEISPVGWWLDRGCATVRVFGGHCSGCDDGVVYEGNALQAGDPGRSNPQQITWFGHIIEAGHPGHFAHDIRTGRHITIDSQQINCGGADAAIRVGQMRLAQTNIARSISGGVAEIQTAKDHKLRAGSSVDVELEGAPYDGTWTVATVPTTDSYTFAIVAADDVSAAVGQTRTPRFMVTDNIVLAGDTGIGGTDVGILANADPASGQEIGVQIGQGVQLPGVTTIASYDDLLKVTLACPLPAGSNAAIPLGGATRRPTDVIRRPGGRRLGARVAVSGEDRTSDDTLTDSTIFHNVDGRGFWRIPASLLVVDGGAGGIRLGLTAPIIAGTNTRRSRTGGVAQLTALEPHGFVVGDTVIVDPSVGTGVGADASFNTGPGGALVTAVTAKRYSYANAGPDVASTGAGANGGYLGPDSTVAWSVLGPPVGTGSLAAVALDLTPLALGDTWHGDTLGSEQLIVAATGWSPCPGTLMLQFGQETSDPATTTIVYPSELGYEDEPFTLPDLDSDDE